ncbi:hypothetical protein CCUS01_06067 [Colletotrichum cuscutae]|uniref:Uncharacterized protein n=1 Tax=Colletotrichum cuscutae TaxID=1209917 RepID=A0AAI9V7T9_9PEZI|nr:hypothetical protein CCUS01_06067 [Colletotrichum cuscutae]
MCHSRISVPSTLPCAAGCSLALRSSQCQGRRPFLLHCGGLLSRTTGKPDESPFPVLAHPTTSYVHCCIAYRRHRTRVWGFLARLRTPRSILLVHYAGPNLLRTRWPLKEPSFHHTPSRLRSPVMLSSYHRAAPATHNEAAAPLTFTLSLRWPYRVPMLSLHLRRRTTRQSSAPPAAPLQHAPRHQCSSTTNFSRS